MLLKLTQRFVWSTEREPVVGRALHLARLSKSDRFFPMCPRLIPVQQMPKRRKNDLSRCQASESPICVVSFNSFITSCVNYAPPTEFMI